MSVGFWKSKRRCIADLLAVFFLPLVANLAASLLLKLLPLGETALRFNAAYQSCLLLAAFAWYRQGGKSGMRDERPFPWRYFAGTLCLYLLLMLLLDRSGFAMSDRLYRNSAGALRSIGGQAARADRKSVV